MEKEVKTRVELYSSYRKEIEESFNDESAKVIKKEDKNSKEIIKKETKKIGFFEEYKKHNNKKKAIYISISCLVILVLIGLLVLFIVKGKL